MEQLTFEFPGLRIGVAEYDDGPVHQGVVAQGIVAVVAADTFLDRNARALRIGAIALVAAWLAGTVVVFFRRRSATHGA